MTVVRDDLSATALADAVEANGADFLMTMACGPIACRAPGIWAGHEP